MHRCKTSCLKDEILFSNLERTSHKIENKIQHTEDLKRKWSNLSLNEI